jgi:membrane associated rhomboid family serine protease
MARPAKLSRMSDRQPAARQRIFNVPAATSALLIVNVAVHVARLLLPADLDDALLSVLAFVPARYTMDAIGWPALVDPVTYQFLHANLVHLGVNMLALLAFGSGVEQRIGGGRMLAFYLICGIASAAVHLAAYPASLEPVVGASGAISGLFGGVLRFQFAAAPGGRRALWPIVILWIVVNFALGQAGMPGTEGASIAWVAHLGGFVMGLLLFDLAAKSRRRAR